MSANPISAIFLAQMPPFATLTALVVSYHADHRSGGNSFAKLKKMAEETGLSVGTIRSYLTKLELYGFIAKQEFPEKFAAKYPPNHRPQCWRILMDEHGRCTGRWPAKGGDI